MGLNLIHVPNEGLDLLLDILLDILLVVLVQVLYPNSVFHSFKTCLAAQRYCYPILWSQSRTEKKDKGICFILLNVFNDSKSNMTLR